MKKNYCDALSAFRGPLPPQEQTSIGRKRPIASARFKVHTQLWRIIK